MTLAALRKHDALLDRLTSRQKAALRLAFRGARRPPGEARQLIAEWVRIAETAHQYALKTEMQLTNVSLIPAVRKRRDRQLRQATAALDRAIAALKEVVGVLEKHSLGFNYESLQQFKAIVGAQLLHLRNDAERYRLLAKDWPAANRSGNTLRWIPERCLGEVLAAYFRHKGWPMSTIRTGLFALVANTVRGQRAMNDKTLRRLNASSIDYATLEAAAPRGVKPAIPVDVQGHRPAVRTER